MALTYTPNGEIGTSLPSFTLKSVDGKTYRSQDFGNRPVVVMFICNHCPYVQAIEDRLIALAHEYSDRAQFIGICANDPAEYPEDSAAELLKRWREKNYAFPYLIDESQDVARAFGAVCTPDLYIYGIGHKLGYRGRLDDSWRNPANVRHQELKSALDLLLEGEPAVREQNPSMGCSIKWKKG